MLECRSQIDAPAQPELLLGNNDKEGRKRDISKPRAKKIVKNPGPLLIPAGANNVTPTSTP